MFVDYILVVFLIYTGEKKKKKKWQVTHWIKHEILKMKLYFLAKRIPIICSIYNFEKSCFTVHTMTYFSAIALHEVLFSCRCIKAALGQCANYWLFLIRGHRLTYTSRHSDRFMVPRGGSSEDPCLQWPTTAEWDIVRYWSQCHFISQ